MTWRPSDPLHIRQPEDELLVIDGPTHTASDFIPTADQDKPVASYPDWRPGDTRVITCRIANDVYPGKRYESRDEALRAVTKAHGPVLEANYVPGRAFLRVRK